jgi:hypothetical protein
MATRWDEAGFDWEGIPEGVLQELALEHLVNAAYERDFDDVDKWSLYKAFSSIKNYWAIEAVYDIFFSMDISTYVNLIDSTDFVFQTSNGGGLTAQSWKAYVGINPNGTSVYDLSPSPAKEKILEFLIPLFETYLGVSLPQSRRFLGDGNGLVPINKLQHYDDLLTGELFSEIYLILNECFTTRITVGNSIQPAPTPNAHSVQAADSESGTPATWAADRAVVVAEWTSEAFWFPEAQSVSQFRAIEQVDYNNVAGFTGLRLVTIYSASGFRTEPIVQGKTSDVENAECTFYFSMSEAQYFGNTPNGSYNNLGHHTYGLHELVSLPFVDIGGGIYEIESPYLSFPINDITSDLPTTVPSNGTDVNDLEGYRLNRNDPDATMSVFHKLNVEGAFDYY